MVNLRATLWFSRHSERSEESRCCKAETLRYAQGDAQAGELKQWLGNYLPIYSNYSTKTGEDGKQESAREKSPC